jgi:hypothetical protein
MLTAFLIHPIQTIHSITMNILIAIIIFIAVLLLYIYITSQFKKSEDLDIYEADYISNKNLQEICDVRQPVVFHLAPFDPVIFDADSILSTSGPLDVKIKDLNDYYAATDASIDAVTLPLTTAQKLMANDDAAHFLSENNDDFLEESGLRKRIHLIDDFVKPSFSIQSKYDVLLASPNATTPLRYHENYRQFIAVSSGKIRVKMTPWKSTKYLHPVRDFENYEFYSPVHPTNPQPTYSKEFEKAKFLDFEVLPGYVLYVPPYWWYSVQFLEGPRLTVVYSVSYVTVMNFVANLPQYTMYWLQQHNIRKKVSKTAPDVCLRELEEEKTDENVGGKKDDPNIEIIHLSDENDTGDGVIVPPKKSESII